MVMFQTEIEFIQNLSYFKKIFFSPLTSKQHFHRLILGSWAKINYFVLVRKGFFTIFYVKYNFFDRIAQCTINFILKGIEPH